MVDLALILLLLSCSTLGMEKHLLIGQEERTIQENVEYLSKFYSDKSGVELSYNYAYYLIADGKLDEAMDIVLTAIDNHPSYIRFNYLKAYIEKKEMKLFSYEETLLDILSFNPGDMTARESLLELYFTLRYKDKAIALAYDTLNLDPSNKTSLNILAYYVDFFKSVAEPKEAKQAEEIEKKPALIPYNRTFRAAINSFKSINIT